MILFIDGYLHHYFHSLFLCSDEINECTESRLELCKTSHFVSETLIKHII